MFVTINTGKLFTFQLSRLLLNHRFYIEDMYDPNFIKFKCLSIHKILKIKMTKHCNPAITIECKRHPL